MPNCLLSNTVVECPPHRFSNSFVRGNQGKSMRRSINVLKDDMDQRYKEVVCRPFTFLWLVLNLRGEVDVIGKTERMQEYGIKD